MGRRFPGALANPIVLLPLLGAAFYGLLNLLFKFHLAADDFTYLANSWAHADDPSLANVIGPIVLRQPIYLIQYLLIRLSPHATNPFYFAFQLVHALNAVLVYKLVAVRVRPFLLPAGETRSWRDPALLAGLFFLFYPNNYEVLYWRTCIPYSLGMTAALAGMVFFPRLSIVLWLISYLCYETFLLFPTFLIGPILLGRRLPRGAPGNLTIRGFLARYSASLVLYGIWRLSSARWWGAPIARYPMDGGVVDVLERFVRYLGFHLSICSSLTIHWAPTIGLWLLLLYAVGRSWGWLRSNRWVICGTAVTYLLALLPVVLVEHFSPRGSFAASVVVCAVLGGLLAERSRFLTMAVLALFISGHTLGAIRADSNARLYRHRVDRIAETVAQVEAGREGWIEVREFERGYRQEWFLQIGFSLDVIESELRQRYPDRRFELVSECPKDRSCVRLDFSADQPEQ